MVLRLYWGAAPSNTSRVMSISWFVKLVLLVGKTTGSLTELHMPRRALRLFAELPGPDFFLNPRVTIESRDLPGSETALLRKMLFTGPLLS